MSELTHGDLCIAKKEDEVFVGVLKATGENFCSLLKAREVERYDPCAIATFGLDETDMESGRISKPMDEIILIGVDMIIKPDAEISSMIAKLFGLEDVAEDE
jgi:hypothetical protein